MHMGDQGMPDGHNEESHFEVARLHTSENKNQSTFGSHAERLEARKVKTQTGQGDHDADPGSNGRRKDKSQRRPTVSIENTEQISSNLAPNKR